MGSPVEELRAAWADRSVSELVEHVLRRYHGPLAILLDRVTYLAGLVREVHSGEAPDSYARVCRLALELALEMREHTAYEENFVFPVLCRETGADAVPPVHAMRLQHHAGRRLLDELRTAVGELAPSDGGELVLALLETLEELDREVREHVRFEDEVLFPAATSG